MAFPVKRVRTLEERMQIIEEVERNPSEKRIDAAKRLGIPPSTLNSIIAKKRQIIEQAVKCGVSAKKRKTSKVSTYSNLENVLFAWYQQARASGIPVDGSILREKSLRIAAKMNIEKFSASNGWITRFKQRHGLISRKFSAESAVVDPSVTDLWFRRLPELLVGYEPRDVYSARETGLFFNCLPDQTLTLKKETCRGGKHAKERLTVLLCTNSDGSDKRVPVVVGNSAKPRCFKHVKTLPVIYAANGKSWMTAEIFSDFLAALDESMGAQDRKILLFIDNCSAHPSNMSFLKNMTVVFYPPNCASVVQPLDWGVIQCFKQVYRRQLVQRAVCLMNAGEGVQLKIDVLQAIHFIVSAWQQVTQATIRNCFVKCGHTKMKNEDGAPVTATSDQSGEADVTRKEDWFRLGVSTPEVNFDAYVNVDRELVTCPALSAEETCNEVGNKSGLEEDKNGDLGGDDDETEPEPVPSFTEALCAFEAMRAFIYAHDITERDQANIANIENLLFSLKGKGASKQ